MGSHFCAWLILAGSAGLAAAGGPKSYRIETVAGSSDLGDGGPALAAEFGNIPAVAVDPWGNLYISDTDHHRVRKVGLDGVVTTIAGTGAPGFSGDGGPAARAQLRLPYGVAVGASGEVYIADLGNNRVRRITPDGIITTIAGSGNRVAAGDGGAAVDASLWSPRSLALDAAGNLYISEFEGHRIRKVSPDGRISTVAGTGSPGVFGDGTAAPLAHLAFPAGLAIDATGALYIADSQNQRIRRIGADGLINTVLGRDDGANLLTPTGVAISREGVLYVADQSHMVRGFTRRHVWFNAAGTGSAGFDGDGGPAAAAPLTSANDVTVDPTGNLFIADGVRVRRVDASGIIQTVAGDGYRHAVGDGGRASSARLFRPSAMALDSAGNLYIADTGTERVRKVLPSGTIETLAGTGVPGFSGDSVPASGSPLRRPMAVALAAAGDVIVADTGNHRIRRVTADGLIATVAGTGAAGAGPEDLPAQGTSLREPAGVCTGPGGAVFVVDTANHRVLRLTDDGRLALAAGSGLAGDSGNEGPARLVWLNRPAACAVDAAGNLLIADTLNHRIRKVTPAGMLFTLAGTGTPGVSGDEGPAAAARLNAPAGVTTDATGSVYLADTGNHRIRQITPDGIIHTIAGFGTAGFNGDGGPATAALLDRPGGLQLDTLGNLYFADTNNHRIRRLTPEAELPPAPVIQASVVNTASLLEGPVAPGEIVTIFGAGLGPEEGVAGTTEAGRLGTSAAGTEVWFDGVPAPVFYAQAGQVNVQVPYTVAGTSQTEVQVRFQGKPVATAVLAVAEAAPALFPVAGNPDGSPNAAAEPAPRGTVITVYGTGEGLTDGPNLAGQVTQLPYPRPRLPVSLTVAGIAADILYAGSAPEMIGVFQVNARMPGGYVPAGAAEMILTIGRVPAPVFRIWLK